MKILSSERRSKHTYFVEMVVSDKDIETLKKLVYEVDTIKEQQKIDSWLFRVFKEFQMLWKKHD